MKRSILTRVLGSALALAMLSTTALAAPGRFADVPTTHWAHAHISRAADNGWISGVGNGSFAPEETLTIAHYMTMLCNAFYPEEMALIQAECGPEDPWYLPAHAISEEYGLYDGTSCLERGASVLERIDREDMAVIMTTILSDYGVQLPSADELAETKSRIPDLSQADVMRRNAIATCYQMGLLAGVDGNGNFAPNTYMTRAQAAMVLCKLNDALDAGGTGSRPQEKPNPKPDPKPEPKPEAAQADFISEVVRLVNIERANAGLAPLQMSEQVNQAAQVRAQELPQLFEHTRPDGRTCFSALGEAGIRYHTAGENIAAGYPTPADVVEGWMNSPGHRANILNGNFRTIGVGYTNSSSGYSHYWVQLFIG